VCTPFRERFGTFVIFCVAVQVTSLLSACSGNSSAPVDTNLSQVGTNVSGSNSNGPVTNITAEDLAAAMSMRFPVPSRANSVSPMSALFVPLSGELGVFVILVVFAFFFSSARSLVQSNDEYAFICLCVRLHHLL